jgi:CRISPR-associated protein Csm1
VRGDNRESSERANPSMEPLISIFSQVKGIREKAPEPSIYFQSLLGSELNSETLFPKEKKEDAFKQKTYKILWEDFENILKETYLKVSNENKLARLHHLLEIFATSIPSAAYYSVADTSLFDHSKTTAAIAACLYQHSKKEAMLDFEKIHSALVARYKKQPYDFSDILDIPSFTLLTGGISGIQEFIYDISSEGAAKGLKGRSVYLSLLPDLIAKYIVRKFFLPYANILFCGGGHFYLLLPLLDKYEINELQEKINKILFNAHKGTFALLIAGIPLNFNDFSGDAFGKKWAEVSGSLHPKKKIKFKEIILETPNKFFGPFEFPEKLCKVCRSREITNLEEEKCSFCESFEEWGEKVIKKKILVERIVSETPSPNYTDVTEVFKAFGFDLDFSETPEIPAVNYAVNERSFWKTWKTGYDGFVYLPNHTPPLKNGEIVDFDDLSDRALSAKKRWALIRGDVDNLGLIFGKGLKSGSLSRVTSLSRNISLYFTFWLNEICKQDRFKDKTYVIYAGGDDFFIVGSWDVMPELAMSINKDFRRFTCQNPHITLSSANFIVPSKKYPLYKAAEICGIELDEKAKSEDKNSIAFLGEAFEWDNFKKVYDLKEAIIKLIKNQKVSNALIQAIYSGFAEFERHKIGEYPIHRVWRLIYSLTRLARRHKVEERMKKIEENLVMENYNLEMGGLYAARWAELEI